MEDKNMQEIIDHGIKKYFDEKEARANAKAEKEANDKKKNANFKTLLEIASGGIILYMIWILYRFANNF